jgi:hypothetical protein
MGVVQNFRGLLVARLFLGIAGMPRVNDIEMPVLTKR